MRHTALILFGCSAGCGGPADNRPLVYHVSGTLLVGGVPAGGAHVAFLPAAGGACPVAVTGPDGRFRLTTRAAGDGAPAGEYVVTVLWLNHGVSVDPCECPDPTIHDRLHGVYADGTKSSLRADVHAGANEITIQAIPSERGWNLPRPTAAGGPK